MGNSSGSYDTVQSAAETAAAMNGCRRPEGLAAAAYRVVDVGGCGCYSSAIRRRRTRTRRNTGVGRNRHFSVSRCSNSNATVNCCLLVSSSVSLASPPFEGVVSGGGAAWVSSRGVGQGPGTHPGTRGLARQGTAVQGTTRGDRYKSTSRGY